MTTSAGAPTVSASSPSTESILQDLGKQIGLDLSEHNATITGRDPVVPSTHRIGDACAAALALAGTAVSQVAHVRGSALDKISISVDEAIMQLTAAFYTKLNGVALLRLFEDPKLFHNSDFYPTKDGRHVFLLLTYPRLRDAACQVLQCPPEKKDFAKSIEQWNAFELEEAINQSHGCAIALRTRQEWREHPQGKALLQQDLISVTKIGESDPFPLSPLSQPNLTKENVSLPLEGIRLLDNGHVIAAPIVSRLAAEFGADVLHISSPDHPDSAAMLNETGLGKLNAFCDLNEESGRRGFADIISEADIYVCNYRSLELKGYSADELAKLKPGIIFVDITGWGRTGPWATRGGFDQLACTATGFSAEEGSFAAPRLPPTYLLNDYLAGILGFAGALSALLRRAQEGGSYVVSLNLASVVMWVQDLGSFEHKDVEHLSPIDHNVAADKLDSVWGPNGNSTYLGVRIGFDRIKPHFKRGAQPAGASPLSWSQFSQT
ncbi:predicted L-carnitine dehydratase [Moesziomyces antarcticus T-34]|uniref:Predicted L-carnitine dehydratase n=1 Tax=Pseudozyma antarctica (strain T-34) TaxID=1151754 RepID=M9MDX7_PSEA3|nr:predicted L-carnitine dehydratase [Moesziomyces antarcticus T-34]